MNFRKIGFPQVNYENEGGPGGTAGVIVPPAGGGAFAWPADLDAPVVETLKSKGMYDDPVKGAVGLAKSYHELQRLHSGAPDIVTVPKADAPPEAWNAFYAKAGRPETADKYDPKPVQGGYELQAPLVDFSKKLAHAWGVPAAKFNAGIAMIQEYMAGDTARVMTEAKTASDAAVLKVKTDMGEEKFNGAVANAQKAFKVMAAQGLISPETLTALERTAGARPIIELMAAIGTRMGGEGSILNGVVGPTPTDPAQMTPEQAKDALAKLTTDADHQKAYWDAKHPGHKMAVDRAAALFAAQHRRAA